MRHRHAISDDDWVRIKDLLPGLPGQHGKVAKDNRLFIDAVLWIARTGAPWRDLPERFGPWNSAWRRFDRWARKGVWQRVFDALQDPDLEWLILDSTIIRAHPCASGAPKKVTGPAASLSRPSAAAGAGSGRRSTGL
jgi:transposase